MRVTDLGEIAGEIVLFGGAVSNLQALEALAAEAGRRRVLCTGDLVGYCADPGAVVARVRALGWPVAAGNVERQLGAGAATCGCGFEAGTACDRMSGRWYAHAAAGVTDDDRAWMRALPDMLSFRAHGRRWAVLHGGATRINRYLWPVSPATAFREEFDAAEAHAGPLDGIVAGHSGIPFRRRLAPRDWVNAGSIGLPAHDGGRETHYAVLGAAGIRFRLLAYDAEGAAAAMAGAGLTQGYEAALLSGWWPSEDLLPAPLRRIS